MKKKTNPKLPRCCTRTRTREGAVQTRTAQNRRTDEVLVVSSIIDVNIPFLASAPCAVALDLPHRYTQLYTDLQIIYVHT